MVGIDKVPFECCMSEDFKQEVSQDAEMLDDGLGDLVAIEGPKHIINLHVMEQYEWLFEELKSDIDFINWLCWVSFQNKQRWTRFEDYKENDGVGIKDIT